MSEIEILRLEERIPVVIASDEGIIVYVNHSFGATYGWKMEDLLGGMLTMLIPLGLRDAHNMGFSRFLITDQPTLLNQPLELKILRSDGTEQPAIHLIIAEKHDGKWLFGARITPMKERNSDTRVT
jgi:PAS domain S-box-containing protein